MKKEEEARLVGRRLCTPVDEVHEGRREPPGPGLQREWYIVASKRNNKRVVPFRASRGAAASARDEGVSHREGGRKFIRTVRYVLKLALDLPRQRPRQVSFGWTGRTRGEWAHTPAEARRVVSWSN